MCTQPQGSRTVQASSCILFSTLSAGVSSPWLFRFFSPLLPVAFPVSTKRSDQPACSFPHQPLGSQMPSLGPVSLGLRIRAGTQEAEPPCPQF